MAAEKEKSHLVLQYGGTDAYSSNCSIFLEEKLLTPMHLQSPNSKHFSIPAHVDSISNLSKSVTNAFHGDIVFESRHLDKKLSTVFEVPHGLPTPRGDE